MAIQPNISCIRQLQEISIYPAIEDHKIMKINRSLMREFNPKYLYEGGMDTLEILLNNTL